MLAPALSVAVTRIDKAPTSLLTGVPLKVKAGFDPTAPDLHLGHTVVLRKLRAFQDLGHEAILIIGDATAMIGDPSGRSVTRPPLSEPEVQANAQTYLDQAGRVIDVRKANIQRNSQWLSGMQLGDFLQLAAKVTVAQILVREDFAKQFGKTAPQTPKTFVELIDQFAERYSETVFTAKGEGQSARQQAKVLEALGKEVEEAIIKGYNQSERLVNNPKNFYGAMNTLVRLPVVNQGQITEVRSTAKPIAALMSDLHRFKDLLETNQQV